MKNYYVSDNGAKLGGPVDGQKLMEQYAKNNVPRSTKLWCPGMDSWQPFMLSPLGTILRKKHVETFLSESHPLCFWLLFFIIPLAILLFGSQCENATAQSCLIHLLSGNMTFIVFYLTCWCLDKSNGKTVNGLFIHGVMLSCASFIIYAIFSDGDGLSARSFGGLLLNMLAYYLIPYKLYNFSPSKCFSVVAIVSVTGLLSTGLTCIMFP